MGAVAHTIYNEITAVAKSGGCIYDSDLANLADLDELSPDDSCLMFVMLDNISRVEYLSGRPLLTAVVIDKRTDMPGVGFFDLARKLGEYDGFDYETYWRRELKRVHKYWSRR